MESNESIPPPRKMATDNAPATDPAERSGAAAGANPKPESSDRNKKDGNWRGSKKRDNKWQGDRRNNIPGKGKRGGRVDSKKYVALLSKALPSSYNRNDSTPTLTRSQTRPLQRPARRS